MINDDMELALCNPLIKGVDSVPDRNWFAWPPPWIWGVIEVLDLMIKAPIPLGPWSLWADMQAMVMAGLL